MRKCDVGSGLLHGDSGNCMDKGKYDGTDFAVGIVGTMLLFYGMRALIALIVKKEKEISSFMYLPSGRFRRMLFISQPHAHQLPADSGGAVFVLVRRRNCRNE